VQETEVASAQLLALPPECSRAEAQLRALRVVLAEAVTVATVESAAMSELAAAVESAATFELAVAVESAAKGEAAGSAEASGCAGASVGVEAAVAGEVGFAVAAVQEPATAAGLVDLQQTVAVEAAEPPSVVAAAAAAWEELAIAVATAELARVMAVGPAELDLTTPAVVLAQKQTMTVESAALEPTAVVETVPQCLRAAQVTLPGTVGAQVWYSGQQM
jgi:hypothetical protein